MAGKRRKPRAQFQLRVILDETIHLYPLPAVGRVSVGRAAECDVHIDDPTVSRHHAVIEIQNGALRVVDDGSSYGLRVRSERVAPAIPVALAPGDTIEAGGAILVIEPVQSRPRPQRRGSPPASRAKASTTRRSKPQRRRS